MTEEQNEAILTRFIQEAWNGRRIEVFDEIMNPDYRVHYQVVPPGIDGYRRIWHSTLTASPDIQFDMVHVIPKDDKVAMLYAADGRPETHVGIAIYRFANGKMAECWAPLTKAVDPQARAAAAEGRGRVGEKNSSEEENVVTLTRFIQEVWNGHQGEVLDEIMAEDYFVHFAGVEPGLAGYKQIWQFAREALPDMQFSMNDVMAKGDKVVLRYNVWGIANPFDGIAIYRFANGKMAECWAVEPSVS